MSRLTIIFPLYMPGAFLVTITGRDPLAEFSFPFHSLARPALKRSTPVRQTRATGINAALSFPRVASGRRGVREAESADGAARSAPAEVEVMLNSAKKKESKKNED